MAKTIRVVLAAALALVVGAAVFGQSTAGPHARESVMFGGLEWRIKDSGARKVGPGPNWFSAEVVVPDANGNVRLRATGREGGCVSAEIVASPSLGYGTYRFSVGSSLDDLAKNLVLGLFIWDDTSAESFHREIDVELGRWNQEGNDAQFVIQPYTVPRNILRFRLPGGLRGSVHSFTWAPDRASFRSEGIGPAGERTLIQEHVFERMIPEPGKEQARINLWCMDSKAPASGTTEVVLTGFEFSPLR